MYEIIDRDWNKSPETNIASYDSVNNVITNYTYNKSNPYIHALYVNRDVNNQTTAWSDHQQTQWGINREHVWPKSHGFDKSGQGGARGDPMHLWAGNGYANNIHSNYYYGYVDKTKSYTDTGSKYSNLTGNYRGTSKTVGSGIVFEPQDCDKGDIARAVFYMVARYNNVAGNDNAIDSNNPNLTLDNDINTNTGTSSSVNAFSLGVLSDLLEWNRLDPPDAWEIKRNDLLYTNFTNNRNPFIDYPDWADYIWGNKAFVNYARPNSDSIHEFSSGAGEEVEATGVSLIASATVAVGETIVLSPDVTPNNATVNTTAWATESDSIATVSNGRVTGVSAGTTDITVTINGKFNATCAVTVVSEQVSSDSDILTAAFTGAPTNEYGSWSGKTGDSGAIYAGNSKINNKTQIQLRSGNNNSGIVSTTSPGKIKKVIIDWASSTADGRKVDVYVSNTAYTQATDLYNVEKQGTKAGSIAYNVTTELEIDGDYQYVGIRSNSDALYIDSLTFEWEIPVTSVELDMDAIELDLNGQTSETLTATVYPENASNKNVNWVSLDNQVATVVDGVVTAVSVGETSIAAVTEDGLLEAVCTVTVVDTSAPIIEEETTLNVSISSLATAGGWQNATAYGLNTIEKPAIQLDENISFYTEGKTDNGKYYTKDNTWRLYNNGSGNIVINAANDYMIKEVTLIYSIKNNGALVDSGLHTLESNVSNTVNATSVTYTVSVGTVMIRDIIVTYGVEEQPVTPKALSSISLSGTYPTTFEVGDEFSLGDLVVTAHFDDESSADVTESASFSNPIMVMKGQQTVIVSYSYQDVEKTATYQITLTETPVSPYINGVPYKLYFHNESLGSDHYFTGSMDGNYGATNTSYSNGVDVYFEKNGSGQNLYFMNGIVKKYIIVKHFEQKPYNRFICQTDEPTESEAWHYNNDDQLKCIYFTLNERNYSIGTYDNHTTFAAFDIGTYPGNYKPQFAESAESLSAKILNRITCDPTGVTSPDYYDNCSWSDLSNLFSGLSTDEKDILQGADADENGTLIECAMAKYDYIVGKYHLDNFIANRTPKISPFHYVPVDIEKNNVFLAISIVALSSLTAIGLYFFIAKKKHK